MPIHRIARNRGTAQLSGAAIPGAARIQVDSSDNLLKYNGDGSIHSLVTSGDTNPFTIGVFNSTTQGYGVPITISQTAALKVYADDNNTALTPSGSVSDLRTVLGRFLVVADQSEVKARVWGVQGLAKLYDGLFSNEQMGGVNGRLEVVQSSGTTTMAGNGISAGVVGIFATAGTTLINTNHIVAGLAAMADIKGTCTQTGKVAGVYVGKYDTTNWSDATSRSNWGYGLLIDEDAVTICPIQVGEFVASAASGGGFAVSATNSAACRVYAEVTADLTSAAMVRSILGRMLVTGNITSTAECFGVVGQCVVKNAKMQHDNAGVMGSFEVQTTAATLSGDISDTCSAGVLGRLGVSVTATTIEADGVLAGLAAMSNITDGYVTVTSGGVLAGLYVGKFSATGTKQSWEWGAYLDSCMQGIYINSSYGALTAGEKYGINVQSAVAAITAGASFVAGNFVATANTAGAGSWMSGIYAKASATAATSPVNGYVSGGEFEVLLAGAQQPPYHSAIVLNMTDSSTGNAAAVGSYIAIRQYGTEARANCLFWFSDHTVTAGNPAVLIASDIDTAATHYIRCQLGATGETPLWIMATTTAPAP